MSAQGDRALDKFASRESFDQASESLAESVLPLARQFDSLRCHQAEGILGCIAAEKGTGRRRYLT